MRRPFCAFLALALVPGALAAKAPRRTWDYAPFCYVKRAPAEPGAAPSSQPLRVDMAALAQALGAVSFLEGGKETALFAQDEVQVLAPALAEALALAEPGEDLVVQSTWKRDKKLFSSSMAVTARVFAQDGRVNVIVHDVRLDYHLEYNLDNRMPKFDYGSRASAGPAVLMAPGAGAPRPDWLVLSLAAPPPVQAAAPAPAAAPPPAPAARPEPAPAAKPAGATIEERLRDLRRFRDQDLITEEEYTKQKQELLKDFAKAGNGGQPRP